jgi:hypothetical protein
VFDLFMDGYTGGDIVTALGLDPRRGGAARVSSVKLKIKIAVALIHNIPLSDISAAKNTEYLAGRMRHRLYSKKETGLEVSTTDMYPQCV